MTNHVARLYALVAGVLVFFVAWAGVVAHPWQTATKKAAPDPRLAALVARQKQVRLESLRVERIVNMRWAVYRKALAKRNAAAAAAQTAAAQAAVARVATPSVRVVTLPPLTVTRVS